MPTNPNVNELIEELRQGLLQYGKPISAHEKNVIVIGDTGSGKSTSINYWLGAQLLQTENGIERKIDSKNECTSEASLFPEIGNDPFDSQTLYPTLYQSNAQINYLDCPGFNDTREEQKLAILMNTKLAIQWLKKVDLVVVTIDYNAFLTSRGAVFKNLLQSVAHILNDPRRFKDNIFFVMTKVPEGVSLKSITDKINHLRNKLQQKVMLTKCKEGTIGRFFSHSDHESDEAALQEANTVLLEKEIHLLDTIVTRIQVINPLDNKESFQDFIRVLADVVQPICARHFNFDADGNVKRTFDAAITTVLAEGLETLYQQGLLLEQEDNTKLAITTLKNTITQLTQLKLTQEAGLSQAQHDDGAIQLAIQNNSIILAGEKENETRQMSLLARKMVLLSSEKEKLDTHSSDEPIVLWTTHYQISAYGWPCYYPNKKRFEYTGQVPIVKVEKDCANGDFNHEWQTSTNYSVNYVSDNGAPGDASVRVFVTKKHHPDQIKLCLPIKNAIAAMETAIEQNQATLTAIKNTIAETEKKIANLRSNQTLLVTIKSTDLKKAALAVEEDKLAKLKVCKVELKQLLDNNLPLYDQIHQLFTFMKIETETSKHFFDCLNTLEIGRYPATGVALTTSVNAGGLFKGNRATRSFEQGEADPSSSSSSSYSPVTYTP